MSREGDCKGDCKWRLKGEGRERWGVGDGGVGATSLAIICSKVYDLDEASSDK